MNEALLCLSFLQAVGSATLQVPQNVNELVKQRIVNQIQATHNDVKVSFDTADGCANKAQYFYTADSIVLEGENELWSGRIEASISDLIDGRKIDFPIVVNEDSLEPVAPQKSSKKWVATTLAVVGAGVLGFFAVRHFTQGRDGHTEALDGPTPIRAKGL